MTRDEAMERLNDIASGHWSSTNWAPDHATSAIIDAMEAVKLSAFVVALDCAPPAPKETPS